MDEQHRQLVTIGFTDLCELTKRTLRTCVCQFILVVDCDVVALAFTFTREFMSSMKLQYYEPLTHGNALAVIIGRLVDTMRLSSSVPRELKC